MNNEIPVFVCGHVFEKKRPVLLVMYDDDWQFLCGGEHDEDEVPRVVGLNHLIDDDPSLRAVLDLPPNWGAERLSIRSPWHRRPIEEL